MTEATEVRPCPLAVQQKKIIPALCSNEQALEVLSALTRGHTIEMYNDARGKWEVRPPSNRSVPDFARHAYRVHKAPRLWYVHEYDDGTLSQLHTNRHGTPGAAPSEKRVIRIITVREDVDETQPNPPY